jgi:hypothetical protein
MKIFQLISNSLNPDFESLYGWEIPNIIRIIAIDEKIFDMYVMLSVI